MIILAQSLANLISTVSGETGIFDRRLTWTGVQTCAIVVATRHIEYGLEIDLCLRVG